MAMIQSDDDDASHNNQRSDGPEPRCSGLPMNKSPTKGESPTRLLLNLEYFQVSQNIPITTNSFHD